MLTLREWTFGSDLSGLMMCPACGNRLELSFHVADIRITTGVDQPTDSHSLYINNYDIHFRLPNSLDLAALAAGESVTAGEKFLLKRCLLSARYQDAEVSVEELPIEILDAVATALDTADPQANVQLQPECVQCGHLWQTAFDIEAFFWTEIQAWAARTLREVDTLARAYCWREADILNMSPQRRQFYMKMLNT